MLEFLSRRFGERFPTNETVPGCGEHTIERLLARGIIAVSLRGSKKARKPTFKRSLRTKRQVLTLLAYLLDVTVAEASEKMKANSISDQSSEQPPWYAFGPKNVLGKRKPLSLI
jgi:hypothetical protein